MLITFEGIDGSGKSTHLKKVDSFLRERKHNVMSTREPGWNNEVSGIIRHLIINGNTNAAQKLYLLLADRADHFDKMVCPFIKGGYGIPSNTVVLSDRCIDSTVAYQGFGENLASPDWIAEANRIATQGVSPTITFLFDLDPEIALGRAKNPNYFEAQGIEFMRRVRQGYLEIAKVDHERIVILDASLSQEEVQKHILDTLVTRFRL